MSNAPAFITCSALSFDWPDGTPSSTGSNSPSAPAEPA